MLIAEILNKLPEKTKVSFELQYMESLYIKITYENWMIEGVLPLDSSNETISAQLMAMSTAMYNKLNSTILIPSQLNALSL